MRFKFQKLKLKKGFTFVELLGALVISSLTLVIITQISFRVTKLAAENEAGDTAVQVASNTAEALLKIRQDNVTEGVKPYACSAAANGDYYLYIDKSVTPNAVKIAKANTAPVSPSLRNVIRFPVQGNNNGLPMQFVPLTENDQVSGQYNLFSRAINLNYDANLKLMTARIAVYWSLYKSDSFHTTTITFSLANSC